MTDSLADMIKAMRDAKRNIYCACCGHAIRKLNHDWKCDEGCKCTMAGCMIDRSLLDDQFDGLQHDPYKGLGYDH